MEQFKHVDNMEVEQQTTVKQPLEYNFYRRLQNMTVKFAETRVGQFVIEQGDRALRAVETTVKWSLPKENRVANLQRPLPWLPFLALILVLRILRFWLSCAALMIGNNPVTPVDMICFIQRRRRKLRCIRRNGLEAIKQREATAETGSLLKKLSKSLLTAVCCTARGAQSDHNVLVLRQHWCKPNAQSSCEKYTPTSKKRTNSRGSECEDEQQEQHMSFAEMIDKYANLASDDDSNYVPTDDDDDNNTTTNTESSADSAVEAEDQAAKPKDLHTTAVIDLQKDSTSKQQVNMPLPMFIKREPHIDAELTTKLNGNDKNVHEENGRKLSAEEFIAEERKATPGHVSAAVTKVKNPANQLNNTAAVDIVAAVVEQEQALDTSAVALSPEATGSFEEFKTPEMVSASSCEDIFYSPIGSPTELNRFMQPITTINNNKTIKKTEDVKQQDMPANNENIEVINAIANTQNAILLEAQQPQQKPQQKQQQKNHYHNQQHHHHVHRYRGKNRRKPDAIP